ncbi:hypothetical protein M199_gp232 [Halogranum tailed virus 1]|uniref:Uncharacterized protein n=1 Tax=Halogranum tailed virus 1 TaxID=1273749 RepID=R4T6W5_9CAUD|nr:hypothetical protein M199_gp232 [Halogranum tailed virus 1]AGM11434.1 hypothetical protein HGTV1_137 [Halogranum tailed virus 1]
MVEYTFYISYYSEASLRITIEEEAGYLVATCTHPMNDDSRYGGVDLGGSWYHFSGPNESKTHETFVDDTIPRLLDQIAEEMYRGSAFYFDEQGEFAKKWFREHLYIAFALGSLPSRDIRAEVADEIRNL